MALLPFLRLLAVTSVGLASPLAITTEDDGTSAQTIQWGECDFNTSVPIECGDLDVPLDYTQPAAGTLGLSLSKVSAVNGPSKGSILVNFGGPGNEGRKRLGRFAPLFLNMTGGRHDIVAFDPRGTGKTIPPLCYTTEEERAIARADAYLASDATDVALGDLWANAGAFANACSENLKGGELMGTAFVARDMMQIVDALDEDGLLRYWGLSYGTVLGATAAAMFPDRMDKVVLDGVVNVQNYYHGFSTDKDQLAGGDAAWQAFLEYTASDLADTLERTAESYRTDPVAISDAVLSYSGIRSAYYSIISDASDLTDLTGILRNIVTRDNLTAVSEYDDIFLLGSVPGYEAYFAISCGDKIPRTDDLAVVMPEISYILEGSHEFGVTEPFFTTTCARWPFEAKERQPIDGPVKTRNPVLFVGNTYDPTTSLKSAYAMSELFPGSVVVQQKGFGHTSVKQPSACTWKIMSDYFNDGVLPRDTTECEVDVPLFP